MGVCSDANRERKERDMPISSNSTYIKEKGLNNAMEPIPTDILEIILRQTKESICKIICNDRENGTGFFCLIPFPDKFNLLPVLITNNHVLDKNKILKNKTIKFSLDNDKIKKEIIIDEKRKTYTNEEYDITIIEIEKEDNLDFNKFLELDINIFEIQQYNNYRQKSIYLLYYSNGNKSTYAMGKIINIDEKDNYNIYHKCSTSHGASGCPIINLNNNRVIGLHKGGDKDNDYNLGTIISQPLNQFMREISIINDKNKNYIKKEKKEKKQIDDIQPKGPNIFEIKDFIEKYEENFLRDFKKHFFKKFSKNNRNEIDKIWEIKIDEDRLNKIKAKINQKIVEINNKVYNEYKNILKKNNYYTEKKEEFKESIENIFSILCNIYDLIPNCEIYFQDEWIEMHLKLYNICLNFQNLPELHLNFNRHPLEFFLTLFCICMSKDNDFFQRIKIFKKYPDFFYKVLIISMYNTRLCCCGVSLDFT